MKKRRHEIILELIERHAVETQEDLLALLREAGFDVTQATVSRDINELGLVKRPEGGRYRYAVPNPPSDRTEKYRTVFQNARISVDRAGFIVVVKCHAGMANAAAAALDAMNFDGVVGTLAGDDTVFVAVRKEEDAKKLADAIAKI